MKRLVLAIALLALVQVACAASANIGAPTPAPTPLPPPTPQVIVIDRPAPAADGNSGLAIALLVVMVVCTMGGGIAIGYIARGRPAQSPVNSVPQSLTLTTNHYCGVQPPANVSAQLTEAQQFAILRKMGHSPESARNMIVSGQARQICAPK